MTQFQMVALGLFGVAVVVAYGREVLSRVKSAVTSAGKVVVSSVDAVTSVDAAKQRVNDLVTVTELRDRLAAVNCTNGVEACTLLLRAMIDYPSVEKKS